MEFRFSNIYLKFSFLKVNKDLFNLFNIVRFIIKVNKDII